MEHNYTRHELSVLWRALGTHAQHHGERANRLADTNPELAARHRDKADTAERLARDFALALSRMDMERN